MRPGGIRPQDTAALRSWFADRQTVLLAGPGLGENAGAVCSGLLGKRPPWAAAVLDADALNALADGSLRGELPEHTVLTPAPRRGCAPAAHDDGGGAGRREAAAQQLADEVPLRRGAERPPNAGGRPGGPVWINTTGNAGLARGGSGDVLAGLLAGLLAAGWQQGRTALDAAMTAVCCTARRRTAAPSAAARPPCCRRTCLRTWARCWWNWKPKTNAARRRRKDETPHVH